MPCSGLMQITSNNNDNDNDNKIPIKVLQNSDSS